jgi:hypothetical protein
MQFNLGMYWDNYLSVYQKYQNLMTDGCYDIGPLINDQYSDSTLDGALFQAI